MRYCCVCKEPWSPYKDVSFFGFPKKEAILKEWLRVIPTVKQYKSHLKVCQAHFHKSDYCEMSGKRILKKNAIPCIFPQSIDLTNSSNKLEEDNSDDTLMLRNENSSSPENNAIPSIASKCDILVDQTTKPDELRIDSSNILILENESALFLENIDTGVSIISLEEKEVQASPITLNVATHISPRRLQPSSQEQKLKHEILILKKKLHRRDVKLSKATDMLKYLKSAEPIMDLINEVVSAMELLSSDSSSLDSDSSDEELLLLDNTT